MWNEQDSCECDGFVWVDKGLAGQIWPDSRRRGVTGDFVSILIYGVCE